jgi:hypothetical protein
VLGLRAAPGTQRRVSVHAVALVALRGLYGEGEEWGMREKEWGMKEKYEGQGLERFWHTLLTLAIIGVVSVLGWSVYAIWRAVT